MKRRDFIHKTLLVSAALGVRGVLRSVTTPLPKAGAVVLGAGGTFDLPKDPEEGARVDFLVGGDWVTEPPRIRRSGHLIFGQPEDLHLDVNSAVSLIYRGRVRGWELG